jgi:hypothetical protein
LGCFKKLSRNRGLAGRHRKLSTKDKFISHIIS